MVFRGGGRRPLLLAGAALVTLALIAGIVGQASSEPKLPRVGPKALVATVLRALSDPPPISGDLHTHIDLGLPSLPDGSGLGGVLGLLVGDRDFRIWSSGDGLRIAEKLEGAERSIIAGRAGVWLWDSEAFEATHLELPQGEHHLKPGARLGGDAPTGYTGIDPAEVVESLLGDFGGTDVSVDSTGRFAGRDAYVIELVPRTRKTLVGRVEVAIDAAERIPLSYAIYPRGAAAPAISAGFTEIGFEPIDPATFSFEPPAGATVRRKDAAGLPPGRVGLGGPQMQGRADTKREWLERDGGSWARKEIPEDPSLRSFGRGWAKILAVRTDGLPDQARRLLPFQGDLVSATELERSGESWIVFGTVPLEALEAVAPRLP